MSKCFQSLLTATFVLSVAWASSAAADNSEDKELGAMDVKFMSYVEARMSESCYLQTRQDGSRYVVSRDQCQETLNSLENELSGVDGLGHELQDVQEFRETFNL